MKKRIFGLSVVIVAAIFSGMLTSCVSGVFNGVAGTTLVRGEYPRLSIAANAPLTLHAHGKVWVDLPTEFLGVRPSGIMNFAVYGQSEGNALASHAHALYVTPTEGHAWVFQPESYPTSGGLTIGRKVINDYTWTTQLIRVPAETDWFSAMWRESDYTVPSAWLARRFSASPDQTTRVVAEYREPWPECLDPEIKKLAFIREECLGDFMRRSEAVFSLQMHTVENTDAAPGPSLLQRPPFSPDMRKLAGELRENDLRFLRRR